MMEPMKRFRSGSTSSVKIDSDKCVKCKEVAGEDILECNWCERAVHRSCTKISSSQYAVLGEIVSNVLFFCAPCMYKLLTALSCYDNTNEVIESKFVSMEQSLSNKISSLSNQLKELEAKCSTNVQMKISESPAASHTSTLLSLH